MPGGRKPKPLEVKIAEGNPGKRPLPDPVVIGGKPWALPPAPEHLKEDGRRFWAECVPALYEIGVLDRVDMPALEMAAKSYERFCQARRVLDAQGLMSRGASGQITEHPAVKVERDAQMSFLRFAEQFGLTASARARLGIAVLQGREMLERQLDSDLGEPEFTPA